MGILYTFSGMELFSSTNSGACGEKGLTNEKMTDILKTKLYDSYTK